MSDNLNNYRIDRVQGVKVMDGIISILKPPGMTSHDVVGYIRKHFKEKKVGHTGTLDPNAVGVLPICIGKATKVVDYIMEDLKTYRAELTFGSSTDTQDRYGETISQSDYLPSEEEIRSILPQFLGEYWQEPPMYSALKVNGKKLYELAREGIEIERKKRKIYIYNIDIISISHDKIMIDVICSKGTYIRTLCYDIAKALGTEGHMSFLIRIGTGNYTLEKSYLLDELDQMDIETFTKKLLPIESALTKYEIIHVPEESFSLITNGGRIRLPGIEEIDEQQIFRIYCKGIFLGLGSLSKSEFGNTIIKLDKKMI